MYVPISTAAGFGVMATALLAASAVVADNYTTAIGLQHGFVEGNPVTRWLIKKVGTSFAGFLLGGTVLISGAFFTNYGAAPAAAVYGIVGTGLGIRAFLNYRKLKKANISLK